MTLDPDYRLSATLLVLSAPLFFWQLWVGIPVALFALFLMIQTALIRLTFAETALEVYRGSTRIRSFPYADWLHWEIFVVDLPVLFYFREVKSIHFVPMLFHPGQLRSCLERYCPLTHGYTLEEDQQPLPDPQGSSTSPAPGDGEASAPY